LQQLGLTVSPDPSGQFADNVLWAGKYRLVFTESRVSQVSIQLSDFPRGVQIGTTVVPANSGAEALAAALGSCRELIPAQGGGTIPCGEGTSIKVPLHGGIELVVHAKP
jgi:hypothetical protein